MAKAPRLLSTTLVWELWSSDDVQQICSTV